ncbi:hypothetical protein D3C76_996220 [compost metagenome]
MGRRRDDRMGERQQAGEYYRDPEWREHGAKAEHDDRFGRFARRDLGGTRR